MDSNRDCKRQLQAALQKIKQLETENRQLKAENRQIKDENRELQDENTRSKRQIKTLQNTIGRKDKKYNKKTSELKDTITHLKKENKKYKALDDFHNGSNTPSSKKSVTGQQLKKITAQNRTKSKRKQGAQKGHKGKTNKPKPTEVVNVPLDKCQECGSKNIKKKRVVSRIVTEQEPPPPPNVVQYNEDEGDCNDCGAQNMRANSGIPKKGNYGMNIVFTVVFNFLLRLPARKNVELLQHMGISIGLGTIHNILVMVCCNLFAPNMEIMEAIRKAKIIHADETSFYLFGHKIWVWIFYDPKTGHTLFLIRPSRGGNVVREVLGDDWKGTIVCDGWTSYKRYTVQRCWAHLLRELDILKVKYKTAEAAEAHRELQQIYKTAKRRVKKAERAALHKEVTVRTQALIDKYRDDPVLWEYMAKLERALPDAFRFVLNPRIPPTNNPAERLLREIVMHRKIRGCLRSEKTMKWMGYLFSCVTTWKNQGLDCKQQLLQYI